MAIRSSHWFIEAPLILAMGGQMAMAQTSVESDSRQGARPLTSTSVREGSESQARYGDIYGYQLMTERERSEYRERMRTAATEQERQQLRNAHHEQMQERARERGVILSGPRTGSGAPLRAGTGTGRSGGN